MTINAFVGKQNADGSIDFVYCHAQASPEEMAVVLAKNCDTAEKTAELIQQGNVSAFGQDAKNFSASHGKWCYDFRKPTFAHGKPAQQAYNRPEFVAIAEENVQYVYLFSDKDWKYARTMDGRPSFKALQGVLQFVESGGIHQRGFIPQIFPRRR